MPDKPISQKMHENVTALLAQGAPKERVQDEIDYWRGELAKESAADPERQKSGWETAATLGEEAGNAATFGATGQTSAAIDAALGRGSFQENRDLQKQAREEVGREHPALLAGAQITGSLINPLNRILGPAAKGAGFFRTAGKAALEGATQAALQSAGENVGTTDNPTGLSDVLGAAKLGGAAGGAMGVAGRVVPVVGTMVRALKAKPLGEAAIVLRDAIRATDASNYGQVAAEAAQSGGTSPGLKAALASPALAPYVRLVERSQKYGNADDATKAQIVYKLLSGVQSKLGKQVEGSSTHLADVALKQADIPINKQTLVSAATDPAYPTMPSWPKAIGEHATLKGQQDAFNRGSDMAAQIIRGTDLAGKKLLKNSPEIWQEEIGQMTPEQAQAALKGVLGRLRDVPEVTSNPVGKFGIVSSTARSIMAPARLRPMVEMLEQQAGISAPSWQALGKSGPGIAGRMSETLFGNTP